MPSRLTERAKVKDLLGIARADTLQDELLSSMIEQASAEAEQICRRKFTKSARVEYYQSYDQLAYDPTPQYIWLDGPIDTAETFSIVWAQYNRHADVGVALTAQDYQLDQDKALVLVGSTTGVLSNLPLPAGYALPSIGASPTGFQVTYTGGYPLNSKPIGEPADPLDDYGVTQVPESLKSIIARKVAEDWKQAKSFIPWDDTQRQMLVPWKKKDIL